MSAQLEGVHQPWVVRARTAAERAWDRIDRAVLRFQGRVDTPGYDRWLPYGFALANAAVLIVLVLARFHSLDLGAETAKYAQATWQISEGLRPDTSLSGGNVVSQQGSLILYPLSVLTAILPRIETLLVLKALALAWTIVPLWRIARRHGRLGIGASSAVVFAFSTYSALHYMNAADFAPAVLAVPALMWAVLAGLDDRENVLVVASVIALACRADLGLAIAGLGILLLLQSRRRAGLVALLLGVGWFLVAIYGLQPWLGDGSYEFLEPYRDFGRTPLRALWGIVSHPVRFAKIVGSLANFQVLVSLLAPVLFLPLTAPRFLLPAVPVYVLYMGADVPEGRLSEAAQNVPITVFVFVATIFALQRSGRTLVTQVRVDRRLVIALLLTAVIFFVRDSPTSPYREPWQWGDRDATDQARLAAIDALPSTDEPVRASVTLLPLLSERLGVYELDTSAVAVAPSDSDSEPTDDADLEPVADDLDAIIEAAVADVDWLLFDTSTETLGGGEVDTFRARLRERGWKRIERDEGIDVWQFTGVVESGVVQRN